MRPTNKVSPRLPVRSVTRGPVRSEFWGRLTVEPSDFWNFGLEVTVRPSDFWNLRLEATVEPSDFWNLGLEVTVEPSDFWNFGLEATVRPSDFWNFGLEVTVRPSDFWNFGQPAGRGDRRGLRGFQCVGTGRPVGCSGFPASWDGIKQQIGSGQMESIGSLANDEKLAAEAMTRIAAEAAALSADELTQVNLDLQQATSTILGVIPEVRALREQIVKELPSFDITQVDKLEDYTLALRFAHAAYQTATKPPDDLAQLSEEAADLRERLVADAKALALHRLIDGRKLESLKGANGISNVAQDLQMLSQILQESWPQIQGKLASSAEDLHTASRLATRITRVVGVKEQSPAIEAAAVEQRLRVFKLTVHAYDEARAAIAFVRRREGDAESITPNLYTGKGRFRPAPAPPTDEPQKPAPSTGTPQQPHAVAPEAVAAAVAAQ